MDLFLRRPILASLLVKYISYFFKLLLSHIEKVAPDGIRRSHLTCIRQLWARERCSRELRRCRHRFCQQYELNSELLAVLTAIHDAFAKSYASSSTNEQTEHFENPANRTAPYVENLIAEIETEIEDSMVAISIKRTVLAVVHLSGTGSSGVYESSAANNHMSVNSDDCLLLNQSA